jgi:hypothetical protein
MIPVDRPFRHVRGLSIRYRGDTGHRADIVRRLKMTKSVFVRRLVQLAFTAIE